MINVSIIPVGFIVIMLILFGIWVFGGQPRSGQEAITIETNKMGDTLYSISIYYQSVGSWQKILGPYKTRQEAEGAWSTHIIQKAHLDSLEFSSPKPIGK